MSLLYVLGVVAAVQAVFILLLTLFVVARRERLIRRSQRVAARREALSLPLARWLGGVAGPAPLIDGMRTLPKDAALSFAASVLDSRVPGDKRDELAANLRGEPWVRWALRGSDSARWWRRLDAARALHIVGTLADAGRLAPLLEDEHPAVRLAAMQALSAVDDPGLVSVAVQRYPEEALAVRLFITSTLHTVWQLAEPTLRFALASPNSKASDLAAWLALAEALNLPSMRPEVTALGSHPDPEVRAAAVRALRRFPHKDSVAVALQLLNDPQDFVRSSAALALGALRPAGVYDALEKGMSDRAWWVRFRCALALALAGEDGRETLRRARESSDRFAREMAEMTSGLSDGAVLELADA